MASIPHSPARVARHDVREKLQRMILKGERRPGSKLRQQELAEQFQGAQGVVREALLELQAFGLVETIDRRGMFLDKSACLRPLKCGKCTRDWQSVMSRAR